MQASDTKNGPRTAALDHSRHAYALGGPG
jgi:hypothetical protein